MNYTKKQRAQQKSDEMYIMNTAMLECAVANDISTDQIIIVTSKKDGIYYLVDAISAKNRKSKKDNVKCYFKKDFNGTWESPEDYELIEDEY